MTEMTSRTPAIAEAIPRRSWRFLLLLVGIGAVGIASMLFAPLEQLLPSGLEVPRALLMLQPAILVVGLSAAGWWAAPKLGLDAPALGALADGGDWIGALRPMLLPAIAGGLLCAFCIALFGFATADLLAGRAQAIELPLATRMLYGGTVEEIIFRWALMPLVALGLCRLSAGRGTALAVANLVAALLFAAGHLPAILMAVPMAPAWLVPAVMAANTAIGLICGWLFVRRGFEAAMIAHALAHLFSVPLMVLWA